MYLQKTYHLLPGIGPKTCTRYKSIAVICSLSILLRCKRNFFENINCQWTLCPEQRATHVVNQSFIFVVFSAHVKQVRFPNFSKNTVSHITTKTNDCEISFKAIRGPPAKTHCSHMHEIACVNTCYESWVMQ